MDKIGRNDPCPCGSGKKYKKCCESKKVVAIDQIIDQEVQEWQHRLLQFAYSDYPDEISDIADEWLGDTPLDEDLEEVVTFHIINWGIFSTELNNGKTIFEEFLSKHESTIQRPLLRETIKKWHDFKPIVAKVQVIEDDHASLIFKNIFNDEQLLVKVIHEEEEEMAEGQLVAGILVPYREGYTFFTVSLYVSMEAIDVIVDELIDWFENSGTRDAELFVKSNYPEILQKIVLVDAIEEILDVIEWENEKQENVAEIFRERIVDYGFPKEVVQMGIMFWYKYCQIKSPKIQNENVYVAVLHYMFSVLLDDFFHITQKELADLYGVSSSTISNRYREMQEVLQEDLEELQSELIELGDVYDVGNDFYNDLDYDDIFDEDDDFDFDDEYDDEDFGKTPSPFIRDPFLMERELLKMQREMEGREFASIEEANQFLNDRTKKPVSAPSKLSKRDQAQELLFDAYRAQGTKRIKLVNEALKLYPNSPDAYNIMGLDSPTMEEAKHYFQKAIEAGEKDLGKNFIKENKGHFWMDVKTRPYMRAKQNFAIVLWDMGEKNSAVEQYKEMLELNPNDNQGIRYSLLYCLLDTKKFDEVDQLLEAYGDDVTANIQFNKVYLEYKKNGVSKRLKMLWKSAVSQNPFVADYILKKKKIPMAPPPYIGLGDQAEAIAYSQEHAKLWWKEKGLLDWIKQQK